MVCSMSFNQEALGKFEEIKVFMGLNQEATNMICFADMAWIDLGTCWSSPNQKETRQASGLGRQDTDTLLHFFSS